MKFKASPREGACFLYINTGMDNCFNTRINVCLYMDEYLYYYRDECLYINNRVE